MNIMGLGGVQHQSDWSIKDLPVIGDFISFILGLFESLFGSTSPPKTMDDMQDRVSTGTKNQKTSTTKYAYNAYVKHDSSPTVKTPNLPPTSETTTKTSKPKAPTPPPSKSSSSTTSKSTTPSSSSSSRSESPKRGQSLEPKQTIGALTPQQVTQAKQKEAKEAVTIAKQRAEEFHKIFLGLNTGNVIPEATKAIYKPSVQQWQSWIRQQPKEIQNLEAIDKLKVALGKVEGLCR